MIVALFSAWLLPVLIGTGLGYWQGKRPATTPGDFAKDIVTAILFAGVLVFMLQMAVVAALMTGLEGGISGLGSEAWGATFITAALWLPSLVIAYIVRALKEKRK